MSDEIKKQEVESTKVISGKIRWFGPTGLPVPTIMANIGKAVRYGCASFTLAVNSAPKKMFTPEQASSWSWWLSVIVIMSGVFELLVGVQPIKSNIALLLVFIAILFLL